MKLVTATYCTGEDIIICTIRAVVLELESLESLESLVS